MRHAVHHADHAFADYQSLEPEGLTVFSRRNMFKSGLAGIAGLSFPELLRTREAAAKGRSMSRKSVILLWMTEGPSHIGTWDPQHLGPPTPGPLHQISE